MTDLVGALTCSSALSFVDGVLTPGTVVDRVEPTEFERKGAANVGGLLEDQRRDVDRSEPTAWVVVVWQGKRRRVPFRAFTRSAS